MRQSPTELCGTCLRDAGAGKGNGASAQQKVCLEVLQVPCPWLSRVGEDSEGRRLLVLKSSLGICCCLPSESWGDGPLLSSPAAVLTLPKHRQESVPGCWGDSTPAWEANREDAGE